ncbi:MAG: hypothetical protein AAFX58_11230 [Pseudomonadota bacterium]
MQLLLATALAIGVVHTLIGPDHYLPFVLLARERNWSTRRTLSITVLCGAGHCASSIAIGVVGIGAGLALGGLEALEAARGELAAWLLLAFGLSYTAYSLRRAYRGRRHEHPHIHADGTVHTHAHNHAGDHEHRHAHAPAATGPLLASLFVIFVLGPCEALIPMLMYPAAQSSLAGVAAVTAVFSVTTIVTMVTAVAIALRGARLLPGVFASHYSGVVSGLLIGACGGAMLLGL